MFYLDVRSNCFGLSISSNLMTFIRFILFYKTTNSPNVLSKSERSKENSKGHNITKPEYIFFNILGSAEISHNLTCLKSACALTVLTIYVFLFVCLFVFGFWFFFCNRREDDWRKEEGGREIMKTYYDSIRSSHGSLRCKSHEGRTTESQQLRAHNTVTLVYLDTVMFPCTDAVSRGILHMGYLSIGILLIGVSVKGLLKNKCIIVSRIMLPVANK